MDSKEFCQELEGIESFLFSFALKLTRNYQNAQDLFQDSVERAFVYRHRFQVGTNFRAWLSTILRHTFINHYREAKKDRTVNEPIETFTFAIESSNIVSNKGERNIQFGELKDCCRQLNDKHRIPFLMHYQGYEYKEIAEYLDIPMGTVKSRLNVARKRLRDIIRRRENVAVEAR